MLHVRAGDKPSVTKAPVLLKETQIMAFAVKLYDYFCESLEAFKEDPADTPFLEGYETAVREWKRMIEERHVEERTLMEVKLIALCANSDSNFRAGFLSALRDINEDLMPTN
jgi:hypothetical protein